jgi:choline dehydrogenase-like flavoprotein
MERYDVVIIGTGAGGGTLAHRLAHTGKKILVVERGPFLPRERENWDSTAVVTHDRYHTTEVWRDDAGREIHPGTGYFVGGNTKVYGGALLRFRREDFERVQHKGGVSPEWPVRYDEFEPYYTEAERLYRVHGQRGLDPTEPEMSADYPHPPVSHEPRIQEIADAIARLGLRPAYTPLGVQLDERDRMNSPCIRCATCDGYPCLVDAKSDADITCVRPVMRKSNYTLWTETQAVRLHASASGREIVGVELERHGERVVVRGDVVVVACGAINSAALLLRSEVAGSSGMVGRHFMKHQNGGIVAVGKRLNPTAFQKTLMVNDFYWGEEDFPWPMGHVSLTGKMNKEKLQLGAPALAPGFTLDGVDPILTRRRTKTREVLRVDACQAA